MTQAAAPSRSPAPGTLSYARTINGALDTLFTLNDAEMTELLLIRHGEQDLRLNNNDAGLSPLGRVQAMRLAARLRRTDFEAVYTSDARVAVETAALLAAAKDLPILCAPQLRDLEINPYALNGSAQDKQRLRFINNPRWDALRGVESTRHFRHRVVQAVEAIISRHPGGRLALVTHQPVINAYLSMVLGIERDMFFAPEFTSLSTVRVLRDI